MPFTVIGQGLHRGPAFLGVLEAVMGVGALVGGALAAPVMPRARKSPESDVMPPASDGQSRVPVGNIG